MQLMKIAHVGIGPSQDSVNGIAVSGWGLANEQCRLGHDVSILFTGRPPPLEPQREGPLPLCIAGGDWLPLSHSFRHLLRRGRFDVVHMHSVFVPMQARLAALLWRVGIPYVVSVHGGLDPHVLRRNPIKKSLYLQFIERPRLEHAAGIALVLPEEETAVRAVARHYRGVLHWLPNPVEECRDPGSLPLEPPPERPVLVFLGRFDVHHKGLDTLVSVAARLREYDVHLYGACDHGESGKFLQLSRTLPNNVTVHAPVFGERKQQVLRRATAYIQLSRWEGCSMSILEAMACGTPCVVSDCTHFSRWIEQQDLGLVVPHDPDESAQRIRAALGDRAKLARWRERARSFVAEHWAPTISARESVAFYDQALAYTATMAHRGTYAGQAETGTTRLQHLIKEDTPQAQITRAASSRNKG